MKGIVPLDKCADKFGQVVEAFYCSKHNCQFGFITTEISKQI